MTYQPTSPKHAWLRNLFKLRLTIRRQCAAQDEMNRLAQGLERNAKLMEARSPLNAIVVQGLRDTATQLRDEFNAMYPVRLKEYGKLIMDMAQWVDHLTTLQERCEALNVNIADRAGLTEKDGIIEIIFGHGLEDSAEYRHSDFNYDRPLFRALAPAFIDFISSTPQLQAAADQALEDIFGITFPLPGERPSDVGAKYTSMLGAMGAASDKPTLH